MRPSLYTTVPALAVLATSFLFTPAGLPGVTICYFRQLTSLPCPGCGLTRSFCAISHGDFGAAMTFNPLGFVFYTLVILVAFYPLALLRWPTLGNRLGRDRRVPITLLLVTAALWIFGVVRVIRLQD